MVNLSDVFIGTKQSRFAGIAIFTAIIIVCISILFTNTDISIAQRIGIVLFIILTSVPSVFLSLFELTCIVTGGNPKTHVLCHYFAWFVAFIIFVYSGLIIVSVILSMFTYNSAMDRVKETEESKKVSKDDANKIAQNIMHSDTNIGEIQESEPSQQSQPLQQSQPSQQYKASDNTKYEMQNNYNPAGMGSSFDSDLSLLSPDTINDNMSFNASSGFNSLSEWKPMNMQQSVKPLTNNNGNLRTFPGSEPEPYINENFSLL